MGLVDASSARTARALAAIAGPRNVALRIHQSCECREGAVIAVISSRALGDPSLPRFVTESLTNHPEGSLCARPGNRARFSPNMDVSAVHEAITPDGSNLSIGDEQVVVFAVETQGSCSTAVLRYAIEKVKLLTTIQWYACHDAG